MHVSTSAWNLKDTFINSSFIWTIPSFYIEDGCLTISIHLKAPVGVPSVSFKKTSSPACQIPRPYAIRSSMRYKNPPSFGDSTDVMEDIVAAYSLQIAPSWIRGSVRDLHNIYGAPLLWGGSFAFFSLIFWGNMWEQNGEMFHHFCPAVYLFLLDHHLPSMYG